MRGRSTKGPANPPRTSASPGTIRKYMMNESNKESNSTGAKNKTPDRTAKMGTRKQMAEMDSRPPSNEVEVETAEEIQQANQLPTKGEIAEMFAKLEASIRGEISAVNENMSHLLTRVEEVETTVDKQGEEIRNLRQQIEVLQKEQRYIRYKMEDQENRSRRKNLRIRGLPEAHGEKENLQEKMEEIFKDLKSPCNISGNLNLDRVHRIRKPAEIRGDTPRDVIVRFHSFRDKEQISMNLRRNPQVKYGETNLHIFQDLAAETLSRRRILKPLLAALKANEVQYSWGFPANLTGRKDGRKAVLRFPEETQNFCDRLGIPVMEIPGWWEKSGSQEHLGDPVTWKPILMTKEHRD